METPTIITLVLVYLTSVGIVIDEILIKDFANELFTRKKLLKLALAPFTAGLLLYRDFKSCDQPLQ